MTLIRMGLQIPNFTYQGVAPEQLFETVAAQAVAAEAAGFDSIWLMDHFYQLPMLGAPDTEMLECYTTLAAIAARTRKVRVGAMVGGVTYRNPAYLAKVVTTLDVVSAGRAIWGIGAAWFEQEHVGFGFGFGSFTERFEKLEEALQIVKSMFVNHTTSFDGKWFTVRDAYNVPKPIQAGGPPVLIGGSGERKTLRMVAQYADACNLFGGLNDIPHKLDVLDEHCARIGRDPKTICRTRLGTLIVGRTHEEAIAQRDAILGARGLTWDQLPAEMQTALSNTFLLGGPDEVREQVQAFLDAGLDGLVFNMPGAPDPETIALAGEVLTPVLLR
jgi:F420-dependent oxidoreductase-like protein